MRQSDPTKESGKTLRELSDEAVQTLHKTRHKECETCEGDGYVDIVDDWGGVIGPAPCPNCSPDDPLEAVDGALERHP